MKKVQNSFAARSFSYFVCKVLFLLFSVFIFFFLYIRITDPAYVFKNFSKNSLIIRSDDNAYDRYFVPVMISKLDFDALIVGTSMSVNLTATKIDEALSVQSINAAMLGSYLYEQHKLLEFALNKKEIKTVVWGIDFNIIDLPHNYRLKGLVYPDYLYLSNMLSRFLYCCDIRAHKFNMGSHTEITVKDFNSWGDPDISIEKLLDIWTNERQDIRISGVDVHYPSSLTENQKYGMEKNIISLVKTNEDCTFYIFFPPYSILKLQTLPSDKLMHILSCKDYLVERLCNFENVYIFDFTADDAITHNLNNYIDLIHYRNSVSDKIIQTMKDKNNSINYDISVQNSKKICMQLKDFDIDILKARAQNSRIAENHSFFLH